MTPEQLTTWRADLALTQRGAAAELGIALANYQRMERGRDWSTGKPAPIDRRTALACAAIRAGLLPEGAEKSCDAICDRPGPNDDISASQNGHNKNASY